MRRHGLIAAIVAIAVVALGWGAWARGERPGRFDYYALSLSWSPTYCASDAGRNDRQQCGGRRRYDFVVHGLWPQFDRRWPEYCPVEDRYVPDRLIDRMLDIMPSKKLVIHEWRKHGTCSGLGQRGYFETTRELFSRIKVPARYVTPTAPIRTTPEQLVRDFLSTNRWLDANGISVHCGNARDRARLREIRICFTKDLEHRSCGDNERRACRARQLVMPPVR
jgi:ribonuclease T2